MVRCGRGASALVRPAIGPRARSACLILIRGPCRMGLIRRAV